MAGRLCEFESHLGHKTESILLSALGFFVLITVFIKQRFLLIFMILNEHNKQEFPPMHTAEHLLNGEMARRYSCGRAFSAHLERKKSKLDYHLDNALTADEIKSLEDYINTIVKEDVKVSEEFISHEEAMRRFDMSRLPEDASQTLRVIKIGDYDQCLCAGLHVEHTGEIGEFRITSNRFQDGVQRLVFKLTLPED